MNKAQRRSGRSDHRNRISDEGRLSLAAAAACFLVGAIGWLVNYVAPGSTTLGGVAIVGCLYLVFGATELVKSKASRPAEPEAESQPKAEKPRKRAPQAVA